MPLVQTRGAASAQGFGEFAQATSVNYIESVFSTWLYTGTGASQTITNGIDLSTKGGLVWIKSRSGTFAHRLTDTARGATKELVSNATTIEATVANGLTAFNSTGFSLGSDIYYNNNSSTYASWTFRKQPKFFDIVKYTGNSVSGRAIPHNLGSAPGCVIIKTINDTQNWAVWHRSGSQNNTDGAYLNTTAAYSNKSIELWGPDPGTPNMNATTFSVGGNIITNENGQAYIAYVFAHNAGGFGLTGTDNVISCGSFTTNGSGIATVNLGYEPQWILFKQSDDANNWWIMDNMRGFNVGGGSLLYANLSAAEGVGAGQLAPSATGFYTLPGQMTPSANFIYIAIRRGPMKVPTDATKVFLPTAFTSNNSSSQVISVGFPSDMALVRERTTTANYASNWPIGSRLTGNGFLRTTLTNAEVTFLDMVNGWDDQNSIDLAGIIVGNGTLPEILYNFQRAPSFFDEVCYTGTSVSQTINHNLNVAPELMIIKSRNTATTDWDVLSNFTVSNFKDTLLNMANSGTNQTYGPGGSPNFEMMTAQPSSSAFFVSASAQLNYSARTFVAYLFATCAGVSKVGSYTGNGTTQTINCGFTSGARFVLIKRTDATGNWYTYDTVRGMTVLTDPYLLLNSSAAEVATLGSVTTVSTGFALNESILAGINTSAATYIFLAIA